MECTILKVEKDYRIFLPQSLLRRAGWISGSKALEAWLLVGGSGKSRLMSAAEFEKDPACLSLKAAIEMEAGKPAGSGIEFRDDALVALGMRLFQIEITPPGPGWRLALPRTLAAIMQIHPGETSVALLLLPHNIEIWTLETLRASVNVPLAEII
jgi:hypothetical protein